MTTTGGGILRKGPVRRLEDHGVDGAVYALVIESDDGRFYALHNDAGPFPTRVFAAAVEAKEACKR